MGATPHHLQRIYDSEATYQRPRIVEEGDKSIVVNKENWVQYLGNQRYERRTLRILLSRITSFCVIQCL